MKRPRSPEDETLLEIVSFNVENTAALAYLETKPYAFPEESVDSLMRKLRDTWNKCLAKGIREGRTIAQLTSEAQKIFRGTKYGEWENARTIVQTEIIGLANMGTAISYKRAGVPYKTWVTMRDGLVRDFHRRMDMVSVPTTEKFRLPSGVEMEAPGDPAGGPVEISNCRCTILAEYAAPSAANGRAATFKKFNIQSFLF
jgi:hypothetical protein